MSLFLITNNLYSQEKEVNPNGYNVFYYPNGFKLSEGNFKDGKPDGYWITYYVNGNKKSEGNRKNFLLDSAWIFYSENGDTTEIINYKENQKNGFYFKFEKSDDGVNYLASKELYIDDLKQGFSYYYYPSHKLHYQIKYENNNKHGSANEYSEDGTLIAIEEYRYNNLVSRKAVNRKDNEGQKTGTWVEVFDNGKIKSEINFVSGMPNGNYKEYSPTGKVLKIEQFENGKVVNSFDKIKYDTLQSANIKVDKEYYPNGNIKSIKNYKDSIPFGNHLFYDKDGKIEKAISYNEYGIKSGEGLFDDKMNKQGKWIFFYDDGNIKAEGEYVDDKRENQWIFYYQNGVIYQKGNYKNGLPEGLWQLFYENSNLWRSEKYLFGIRNGMMYELSPAGDTIVKGKYEEGDETGEWYYKIGDEYSIGNYFFGQKTGEWKTYYYPQMRIKSVIEYSEGKMNGKYVLYYPNKKLQTQGKYKSNEKDSKWTYFYEDGTLNYTVLYSYGEILKVNDIPIK